MAAPAGAAAGGSVIGIYRSAGQRASVRPLDGPILRPDSPNWAARIDVRITALRAIHDEQVLMWELFWQSSRAPVDRAGPLSWTPSLDGPRLTGRHLPSRTNPRPSRP